VAKVLSYAAPPRPAGFTSAATADAKIKDAIEYCSFAITALKHNEVNMAKERLREALSLLE
jgi:hypothetical protein